MASFLSLRCFSRRPGPLVANVLRLLGTVTVVAVLPKVRAATDAARVTTTAAAPENRTAAAIQPLGSIFIREYRVRGAHLLSPTEIEEAVYPFLGPKRGAED